MAKRSLYALVAALAVLLIGHYVRDWPWPFALMIAIAAGTFTFLVFRAIANIRAWSPRDGER